MSPDQHQHVTEHADRAWDAMLADPSRTVLATDFDGVLSPIVDDPAAAHADPHAIAALARLARVIGQVVIITGRPVRTAVELGGLDRTPGLERLIVLGQYGVERWDAATDHYDIPPAPEAVAALEAELPGVLAGQGWADAAIEHKGRALGVHTRRLADPRRAFDELTGPVTDLARRHGLQVEPGKLVLEIRPPGMDKGAALRGVVEATGARCLWYAGDDLGDIPAFDAAIAGREQGLAAATIWSASEEQPALRERADVVVSGPAGFADWLEAAAVALTATS